MLKSMTGFFVRVAERWMPDPLVIAIGLTMVCFGAAVILTPLEQIGHPHKSSRSKEVLYYFINEDKLDTHKLAPIKSMS
jgi:short subunit fatty acids transporter